MNVLITNANSRMALCLARSMAKKGHRVIVGDYVRNALTFFSRYVSAKFLYPSPYSAPDEFLGTLRDKIRKYSIDVVIPVHEETFLISKHQKELKDATSIASADYEAILSVHCKDKLHALLKALKILSPKTVPLIEMVNDERIREQFTGKVVLKPRQGGGNWGIHIIDQGRDYIKAIEDYLATSGVDRRRVLVQEWIPVSKKYSHVVLYQDGELVQEFADCHLRDVPLGGGAGCLRMTCDPGPMTDISKKLFDHLGWHGIAEVEYVTHEETGEYYPIEINPRIWGGVNSAIRSGLDIGDIMTRIATGKRVEPVHYKRGVKTRWFWGDLRVFPDYFRSHGRELGSLWEYIKLMFDSTKTDEFYWDDPIPFFIWPAHAFYKLLKNRSITPAAYDSLAGEWE